MNEEQITAEAGDESLEASDTLDDGDLGDAKLNT